MNIKTEIYITFDFDNKRYHWVESISDNTIHLKVIATKPPPPPICQILTSSLPSPLSLAEFGAPSYYIDVMHRGK